MLLSLSYRRRRKKKEKRKKAKPIWKMKYRTITHQF